MATDSIARRQPTRLFFPFLITAIDNDLNPGAEKPLWSLSSYGPGSKEATLIQGLDESPEELRFMAWQVLNSGDHAKVETYEVYERDKIAAALAVHESERDSLEDAYRRVTLTPYPKSTRNPPDHFVPASSLISRSRLTMFVMSRMHTVRNVVAFGDKSLWPLSSYAGHSEATLVRGLDESPEELRFKSWQALKSGESAQMKAYETYEQRKRAHVTAMYEHGIQNVDESPEELRFKAWQAFKSGDPTQVKEYEMYEQRTRNYATTTYEHLVQSVQSVDESLEELRFKAWQAFKSGDSAQLEAYEMYEQRTRTYASTTYEYCVQNVNESPEELRFKAWQAFKTGDPVQMKAYEMLEQRARTDTPTTSEHDVQVVGESLEGLRFNIWQAINSGDSAQEMYEERSRTDAMTAFESDVQGLVNESPEELRFKASQVLKSGDSAQIRGYDMYEQRPATNEEGKDRDPDIDSPGAVAEGSPR